MAVVKKEGNKIYVQDGNRMRLVGEVWSIDESGPKTLQVTRDRESHLVITSGSYGFAKDVMDNPDWFEYVHIDETFLTMGGKKESQSYVIPRKELILHSRVSEVGGFERQYFIKLETLKKYII